MSTPAAQIEQRSAAIRARLLERDEVLAARGVALFWPIEARHEIDLRPLHDALRAMDKKIAYPVLGEAPGVMEFRFVDDESTLEERGHGFAEPPEDAPLVAPGELDVIVVPALALDARGGRIGYGACLLYTSRCV